MDKDTETTTKVSEAPEDTTLKDENTTAQAAPMSEQPTDEQEPAEPTESQTSQETEKATESTAPPTATVISSKKPISIIWKWVAAAILLLVVAAGIIFVVNGNSFSGLFGSKSIENTDEKTVASLGAAIQLAEGTVQYSTDGSAWMDATGGESILAGHRVRTLADSRAVLLIDDGSAVRLDENTTVQLSVSDTSNVEILLISGQAYTRVVEDSSRVFAVVTNKERFEALGTAYKTSTSDDSDTVEVYQSKVKIGSSGDEVEEGNTYNTEKGTVESVNIAALEKDKFVQWNKEEDSKEEKFKDKLGVLAIKEEAEEKEETPAEQPSTPAVVASISLAGAKKGDSGIRLEWSTANLSSGDGFKIVYSKSDSTPSYKENTSIYVGKDTRSKTVGLTDGKSYYFRVCAYRAYNSTCDTYSNSVKITAPLKEIEKVQAGAVSLTLDGNTLSWTFGGTAPHGFKVLLSGEENPTYPQNSIKYVGAGTTSITLEKPSGTYYAKVCKYTASGEISGGCTDYSNQVTYIVSE